MRCKEQRVVITGASRGIGHAIATAFRAEGAYVVGTKTDGSVVSDDPCDEWFIADFSDRQELEGCVQAVRRAQPDILVNNAGINIVAPFTEVSERDFLLVQQVNVLAPLLLCQAAVPPMRARGWGRIVNLSSLWGKVGKEHRVSYSASKFALDGVTVSLAAEVARDGILVNSIAPGFIDTDLTRRVLGDDGIANMIATVPAKRLGTTTEVARLAVFLGSADNGFITGQNIAIDGGRSRA